MTLETLRQTQITASQRFTEADDAWSALLPKTANARYLPIGQGTPGSDLRQAYKTRMAAMERWEKASRDFREADLNAFVEGVTCY